MFTNDKKQIGIRLSDNNYQRLIFLCRYHESKNSITNVSKSDVINFLVNEYFEEINKLENDADLERAKKNSGIDIGVYRDMERRYGF